VGDLQVLFKPHDYFSSNLFQTVLEDQMVGLFDKHDADEELCGYTSKTIKSSLNEKHDPHHVAKQQTHLSTSQRQELTQLLARFPKLFSGKLGCFPNKQVHLELKEDAKLFWCCLYPVPKYHEQVFKDELQRLCDIGVLERCGPSKWLSPSCFIAKKDSRVWELFLSTFLALHIPHPRMLTSHVLHALFLSTNRPCTSPISPCIPNLSKNY
jgi:hypothetical protein